MKNYLIALSIALLLVLLWGLNFYQTNSSKKISQKSLENITLSLEQLSFELANTNKSHIDFLHSFCMNEKHAIRVENSNELFKSIEQWKLTRNKLKQTLLNIHIGFNDNNERLNRETNFAKNDLINLRTVITSNTQTMEDFFTVMNKTSCNTNTTKATFDYRDPVHVRTCLIDCEKMTEFIDKFNQLSKNEIDLIKINSEKIKKASKRI